MHRKLELSKLASPAIVDVIWPCCFAFAAFVSCQTRAENKLKCAKSTLLFWLAHILPPSPSPLPFDAFELFCFVFRLFILSRFLFLFFLFVFICVVWHPIVSNADNVVGLVRARRAATVCAIIGINAKHPNVLYRSMLRWLLPSSSSTLLSPRVVGDGTDVWILRYHGAMKRNCVSDNAAAVDAATCYAELWVCVCVCAQRLCNVRYDCEHEARSCIVFGLSIWYMILNKRFQFYAKPLL